MDNLQKRLYRNFPTVILALIIVCQVTYPQKTQTKLQNEAPTFTKCWFYPTKESGFGRLASDNDLEYYLSSSDGKLLSLNSETLEKLWETNLAGNIVSEMIVDKENIYITTQKTDDTENLIFYALDKLTGIAKWRVNIAAADKVYLFDADNSLTIVLTGGVAYSLAKTDGKLLWTKNLENGLSARPLKKPTEIILGTVDKQIIYLSLKDGETLQKFKLNEQSAIIAEDINGSNLIVGDRKGNVWSLNKKKRKRRWTLRQGAEISSLSLTAQGLLISSFDNFVYLVSETSGKLIWKKRLPGRIAAEPQIIDDYLIVSSVDESAAFVLDLNSGKLVNKILLEDNNFFTGESIRMNNLFIYATRRGIFSFSMGGNGCQMAKK